MPLDEWKRYLRRNVAKLQANIREDLRLVSCGFTGAADGYALWLDCERVGACGDVDFRGRGVASLWRGSASLPRAHATPAADPIGRRNLLLALAQALSDISCRSGAGVGLWRDGGGGTRAR
ncbi:hypothetical protein KKG45_02215, partial [bacterium]|nr:hypothetical protein [bacterium]